ncbi:lytic transglycosylase domain-containing protein [Terriglobus roseus]|uniref:lytic transglycosylase domain-containing protein n=1 Tax=Terriglobus roseus TaxID=392734 RepID=UPI001FCCDDE8|nr:lytic transglycosylase domain-containing protein [Terriglobus roseus]
MAPCARAAEIVTLQSGFTIRCASREPLSADTVRLHLRSTGDADNYMDVPAGSIATVETTSDELPAPVTATQTRSVGTAEILATSGARHNVNVALLAAVVHAESAGNARAVSRSGAQGLMQLMPGTAAALGVGNTFDPASNVNGGSAYLDALLTRYHDNLPLALAAYNAGPGAVDRYHGIPPFRETQAYVARVIREFNRRIAQGKAGNTTMAAR